MLKAQLKKRVVMIDMKTSFININVCPGKKFGDLVNPCLILSHGVFDNSCVYQYYNVI